VTNDEISCERFITGLDDFVSGELDAAERERSNQHLASCLDCASYLADYRATIDLARNALRDPTPPEPPESLVQAILDIRRRD